MAMKRIQKELNSIGIHDKFSICYTKSVFELDVAIYGPPDSPYEGGFFFFDLIIPSDYPFKMPKLHAKTRIFHHNIGTDGYVKTKITSDMWSPAYSIVKILEDMYDQLREPYGGYNYSVNDEALHLFEKDYEKYKEIAKQWTKKYAM
ncbi:hypothetical protein ABPG74_009524 [Tetrahymena malaccensis]